MTYATCSICGGPYRLTQPTGAYPSSPVIDVHGSTKYPAWVDRCPGSGLPAAPVAVAISARLAKAPCERGAPRPVEPRLPASLTPEEHNRRIAAYQRSLERWYGA